MLAIDGQAGFAIKRWDGGKNTEGVNRVNMPSSGARGCLLNIQ